MPGDGTDLIHRYAERLKQQQASAARPAAIPESPARREPAESSEKPVHSVPVAKTVPATSPVSPVAPDAPTRQTEEPTRSVEAPRPASKPVRIDFRRLQRFGFIVPDADEKTKLSEEFRLIKLHLILKAFAKGDEAIPNGNVVMVTSARPGEGKTFFAVNLALSVALERDLHVMLVDTDVYSQAVLSSLGLTAEKGLVDVLLDPNADLADVILKTNIPNFSVVPSGFKHPNASELMSSQRMAKLAEDMSERYPDRMIIFDSPPILASSETTVLASHVGQIVVVVEQNRTGWHLVERSLAQIERCPEISFVLNKVTSKMWEENYASRYGYGYKANS